MQASIYPGIPQANLWIPLELFSVDPFPLAAFDHSPTASPPQTHVRAQGSAVGSLPLLASKFRKSNNQQFIYID